MYAFAHRDKWALNTNRAIATVDAETRLERVQKWEPCRKKDVKSGNT